MLSWSSQFVSPFHVVEYTVYSSLAQLADSGHWSTSSDLEKSTSCNALLLLSIVFCLCTSLILSLNNAKPVLSAMLYSLVEWTGKFTHSRWGMIPCVLHIVRNIRWLLRTYAWLISTCSSLACKLAWLWLAPMWSVILRLMLHYDS